MECFASFLSSLDQSLRASYNRENDIISHAERGSTVCTKKPSKVPKLAKDGSMKRMTTISFGSKADPKTSDQDKDFLFARRLQASYDRENDILERCHSNEIKELSTDTISQKRKRIDSYFVKKR